MHLRCVWCVHTWDAGAGRPTERKRTQGAGAGHGLRASEPCAQRARKTNSSAPSTATQRCTACLPSRRILCRRALPWLLETGYLARATHWRGPGKRSASGRRQAPVCKRGVMGGYVCKPLLTATKGVGSQACAHIHPEPPFVHRRIKHAASWSRTSGPGSGVWPWNTPAATQPSHAATFGAPASSVARATQ